MELEEPLPCLNSPPLFPILSQDNPVHALPYLFLRLYFNIITQSTPGSSKWLLPRGFCTKTVCISAVLHMRHMLRQFPSSFDRREAPYYAVSSIPLILPPTISLSTVNSSSF